MSTPDSHATFRDGIKRISRYLPPLNFLTIHYLYFVITCLITSVIFWGSSTPARSITYTDSLFLVVSAMTEAGLNTVNLSQMNTFQQCLLWVHIMIGSAIFVSAFVVLVRKRAFETRFETIIKAQKEEQREHRRSYSESRSQSRPRLFNTFSRSRQDFHEGPRDDSAFESRHSQPRDPAKGGETMDNGNIAHELLAVRHIDSERNSNVDQVIEDKDEPAITSPVEGTGLGHVIFSGSIKPSDDHVHIYRRHHILTPQNKNSSVLANAATDKPEASASGISHDDLRNLYAIPERFIGRNSQFHDLTSDEREVIGGVEYRAIKLLSYIVPIYSILWQLLGCLGLGAYMAYNKPDVARGNGINPWWLGAFNAVSAFNNSGMTLLDANVMPFQTSYYVLLTMGLLILAGNTAYPIFLRFIIWTLLKLTPNNEYWQDLKTTLRFVLDHPRRVYTNLFPSHPTWWLAFVVVLLNGIDWAAFELLNIGNKNLESIPGHFRVLDGFFQALAIRSGGFYVVSIPTLRIGVQVLYVLMMYISVYPVVITMRNSNVYEERSLGIFAEDTSNPDNKSRGSASVAQNARRYFLRQQLRNQLAHDLWWIMMAILFIACIEGAQFERDPATYSVFNIAFEVVSGYACVGVSTGLPDAAYSFSGGWHVCSKLILVAVMLRGRHRGLPVAIDRAVLLPGEALSLAEEEDWNVVRQHTRESPDV